MSSSASSSPSPSPSPTTSVADLKTLPTLERLVAYYVSAKRALGSTETVRQATQLVTESKVIVEDIAVVGARNGFIAQKAAWQVDILHAISAKIAVNAAEVDDEFQNVLAKLDEANDRLQGTIQSLKDVIVDASLARTQTKTVGHDEEEAQPKTLFDYVDESQYNELSAVLKTYIDSFNDSRARLETFLNELNTSITSIVDLTNNPQRPDSPTINPILHDEPPVSVAEAFSQMEEHAGEMASLVQSLISHYDLCVSALKHTEGGREAARQAILNDDETSSADQALDDSLHAAKATESMSNEERSEILKVIEGDAAEVDEVVDDLHARGNEIERFHQQMIQQAGAKKTDAKRLVRAIDLVRQVRNSLPTYLESLESFRLAWTGIEAAISAKALEIVGLCAFYEEFVVGYGRLLREMERRAVAGAQMRKLADKAQKELDRLYDNDRLLREEFVDDVGSFLPSDLWPGVAETGARWHVHPELPVEADEDDDQGQTRGIEIA